jgi:hypothetical protein
MRRSILITFMTTVLLACSTQGAVSPLPPGRYCMVEELFGYTGREDIPLGTFWMVVDVEWRGDEVYVWLENSVPDTRRHLRVDGQTWPGSDGVVRFRFVDGWNNLGYARVSPDGEITLVALEFRAKGFDTNVHRNYGTYHVTKDACIEHGFQNWKPVT